MASASSEHEPPLFLDPDVMIALAYARGRDRKLMHPLFALDVRLADCLRQASEPLLMQIRLAWWRDAIGALGEGALPSSDPLLTQLALLPDMARARPALIDLVNGWEMLAAPMPFSADTLVAYAEGRGGSLFRLAARGSDRIGALGTAWALADFAFRCSDRATAATALDLASAALVKLGRVRRGAAPLPLLILLHLLRRDVADGLGSRVPPGSPRRMARALRYALAGW